MPTRCYHRHHRVLNYKSHGNIVVLVTPTDFCHCDFRKQLLDSNIILNLNDNMIIMFSKRVQNILTHTLKFSIQLNQ